MIKSLITLLVCNILVNTSNASGPGDTAENGKEEAKVPYEQKVWIEDCTDLNHDCSAKGAGRVCTRKEVVEVKRP